jgi:hypothetical protein
MIATIRKWKTLAELQRLALSRPQDIDLVGDKLEQNEPMVPFSGLASDIPYGCMVVARSGKTDYLFVKGTDGRIHVS